MADDIVKRLRVGEDEGVDGWWFVMAEAADEIERLRAEIARLRAAINPYADAHVILKTNDLRAAKAALEEK